MANSDVRKLELFIERQLEKGFSLRRIKQKLVAVGHPVEAIEKAQANVFLRKPYLKRAPHSLKFLTLFLLGIVATALVVFVVIKVAEQQRYERTIAELELNQSFSLMTDNELLYYARDHDTFAPCPFVKGHNKYYACLDKIWEKRDCSFELLLFEGVSECFYNRAISENNISLCNPFLNGSMFDSCRGFFFDKAVREENALLCNISDPLYVSDCVSAIALKKNDRTICNFLPAGEDVACRTQFLEYLVDEQFVSCGRTDTVVSMTKEEIARRSSRIHNETACKVADFALKKDVVGCEMIEKNEDGSLTESDAKDSSNFCFFAVAYGRKDGGICLSIKDGYLSADSLQTLCKAKVLSDVGVCDQLKSEERSLCLAVVKADLLACRKLEDITLRTPCQLFISLAALS
ncbi:hypothetical protein HY772_10020 [Candidatus Woesearchaeota archaeon]|nr:hypothetical protein [Candidatus Woesearchaeota archaeon]